MVQRRVLCGLCRNKEKCLKPGLKCNNRWSSSTEEEEAARTVLHTVTACCLFGYISSWYYCYREGLHQGRPSPNNHDATLPLPFFLFRPSSFSPSPFTGVRRYIPGKNGIKDACRWVLEHVGHKNQHPYEPDFLTVSCNFRISSKCVCGIKSSTSLFDRNTRFLLGFGSMPVGCAHSCDFYRQFLHSAFIDRAGVFIYRPKHMHIVPEVQVINAIVV